MRVRWSALVGHAGTRRLSAVVDPPEGHVLTVELSRRGLGTARAFFFLMKSDFTCYYGFVFYFVFFLSLWNGIRKKIYFKLPCLALITSFGPSATAEMHQGSCKRQQRPTFTVQLHLLINFLFLFFFIY